MAVNQQNPPRVVLLGATGFVGSAVLRELASMPLRLRAVARHAAPVPDDAVADVEVRTADLTEPGVMASVVADADIVVHTVAYIAGASTWRVSEGDTAAERVNVGLVRDLVAVLRDTERTGPPPAVLFTGAASQAGPVEAEVLDGSEEDRPVGEYDRQKLAAERVLMEAHAEGVVRGVSLRLPTVFGYGPLSTVRDKGVVTTMVRKAIAGDPITMWHDGTVRRDLLYVQDVARAVAVAIGHVDELAGKHWLLGTGEGRPLGGVFETVARLVSEETGKDPVPVTSVEPPAHAETGDFRSITIDASAFGTATGWRPATTLEDGLRATVAFAAAGREGELS